MPLSSRVFLERISDGHWPVAQELAIHGFNCSIGGLKVLETHKAKASRGTRVRISHDLWSRDHKPKSREGIIQQLLIHVRIQVSNEEISTHVYRVSILRRLVDTDRLVVKLDHIEYLARLAREEVVSPFPKVGFG